MWLCSYEKEIKNDLFKSPQVDMRWRSWNIKLCTVKLCGISPHVDMQSISVLSLSACGYADQETEIKEHVIQWVVTSAGGYAEKK